jgi:hypothetical protein
LAEAHRAEKDFPITKDFYPWELSSVRTIEQQASQI